MIQNKSQLPDNEVEKILRLKEIRSEKKLSQQQMADLLKIDRSNLSAIENMKGGRFLPKGTDYILESELNINRAWFETGKGNKYLSIDDKIKILDNKISDKEAELEIINSAVKKSEDNGDITFSRVSEPSVPYLIPAKSVYWIAIKDYDTFFNLMLRGVKLVDQFQVSGLPFITEDCLGFEIDDKEMSPEIRRGDFFIGSKIESDDDLVPGRIYLFVTPKGLLPRIFERKVKKEYHVKTSSNKASVLDAKFVHGIFHKEWIIAR